MKTIKLNKVEIQPAEWKIEPERKSLQYSLRYILLIAEVFGLMPVIGVMNPYPNELSFSWGSPRFLYNAFLVVFTMFAVIVSWLWLFTAGFSFYKSTGAVFFLCTFVTIVLFIKLAKNWPKLMKEWAETENQLQSYNSGQNLHRRIIIVSYIIGILGLVEHLLSLISAVVISQTCKTAGNRLQAFNEVSYNHFFGFFSYAAWKGVAFFLLNVICTFSWNFLDLFIMVMSMALTELFARITKKLHAIEYRATPESTWRQIREDYNRVCNLCRSLNGAISDIVFLSFASNLFFICAQILHSIKPMENVVSGVYFFFSITYLMVRALALTLIASRINEESRQPLHILFSVPGYAYCAEIGRFVQQIGAEVIALTGMSFFAVRRGIVLTVAGTIVTYELVLVQFNADQDSANLSTLEGPRPCLQA